MTHTPNHLGSPSPTPPVLLWEAEYPEDMADIRQRQGDHAAAQEYMDQVDYIVDQANKTHDAYENAGLYEKVDRALDIGTFMAKYWVPGVGTPESATGRQGWYSVSDGQWDKKSVARYMWEESAEDMAKNPDAFRFPETTQFYSRMLVEDGINEVFGVEYLVRPVFHGGQITGYENVPFREFIKAPSFGYFKDKPVGGHKDTDKESLADEPAVAITYEVLLSSMDPSEGPERAKGMIISKYGWVEKGQSKQDKEKIQAEERKDPKYAKQRVRDLSTKTDFTVPKHQAVLILPESKANELLAALLGDDSQGDPGLPEGIRLVMEKGLERVGEPKGSIKELRLPYIQWRKKRGDHARILVSTRYGANEVNEVHDF